MCFKIYIFLVCLHIGILKADENMEESRSKRGAGPYVIEATKLSQSEHQLIVKLHNLKRSQVTPPATNMLKLVYDQGLADLAVNYSRNCVYDHNDAPATSTYDYAGENLYVSTKIFSNLTKALAKSAQLWFDEGQDYTYETISCKKGKVCGHYTQMVWASNAAVGCGVTTCGNLQFKGRTQRRSQLVVCNYGPGGNYRGENPYMTGTTCSACPAGKECLCEAAIPESATTPVPDATAPVPKPTTTQVDLATTTQVDLATTTQVDLATTAQVDLATTPTTTTSNDGPGATSYSTTEGSAISYRSTNLVWILSLLQAVFLFANI